MLKVLKVEMGRKIFRERRRVKDTSINCISHKNFQKSKNQSILGTTMTQTQRKPKKKLLLKILSNLMTKMGLAITK